MKGIQAESHGIGSKIEVEAGGKKMIREIDGGGSSHISQNSVIAHFGLGNASKIDKITVYWTGGNKQTITDIGINQLIKVIEIPAKKSAQSFVYVLIGFAFAAIIFLLWKKRKKR